MNQPVRLRIIVLGAVLAVAHTVWVVYEETVWGHLGSSITAASLVSSAIAERLQALRERLESAG